MQPLAAQLAAATAQYERLVRLYGPRAKRTVEAHEIAKSIRNRMIKRENRTKKKAA